MTIDEKCETAEINSPITGIFHDREDSGKNDSRPYVTIGSHVIPEAIVCDVEAVGVKIPVEAGVYGIIKEILVNPGDAVEYHQILFKITPSK